MDWITCPSCEEEFKIITENTTLPEYCPYCSAELHLEDPFDEEYEEYALSVKLLGNCRVSLITNTGNDVIGIIRGNMRKFNKRVLIEVGDIVAISKRDFA